MTFPQWLAANAKAITALVTSLVAYLLAKYAINLPPDIEAGLSALVVSLLVFLVPNTQPPPPAGTTSGVGSPPAPPPGAPKNLRSTLDGVPLTGVWALGLALAIAGCNARDAHDIGKLTVDSINCIMQQPDGATPEQIAASCAIADVPDVLQLIVDLLAQRRAAEKAGVSWKPIAHDGGAK